MNDSEQHCRFEMQGDRLVCRKCTTSLPGTLKQPVGRKCVVVTPGEEPGGQRNDRSATGPCRYEGEPAGKVDCRTCAGAVQIKTFACNCPHVAQPRAAWSEKALPEDVAKCGGCSFYVSAAGTSADPPARDASGAE